MEPNQNTSLFQLNLDAQNSYTLRSAASWAKVLGVAGMILGILFVIFGIILQQTVTRYGGDSYRGSGLSSSSIGNLGMAVYLVMGLVMVISSIFALSAGNKISRGLKTNDQDTLNSGFAGARNYFAFWAVIILLLLLLLLISLLSALGNS
jgi:hypothetical protein